ncbi:hypothetical protein [Methylorubrum extorquens]|uniref:hypothetical protein n=1 Tax=Methylorubrum extorquens TaxID=408 RepID=UPI00209FB4F9|nr:hypothetical protein [Methylorubrum extorquens]MCP1540090.1 hypothetical protein [Methylorubrum extorquens]
MTERCNASKAHRKQAMIEQCRKANASATSALTLNARTAELMTLPQKELVDMLRKAEIQLARYQTREQNEANNIKRKNALTVERAQAMLDASQKRLAEISAELDVTHKAHLANVERFKRERHTHVMRIDRAKKVLEAQK